MTYQALYRTHRPQTFADLIGQEAVKRVLFNALRQNKVAHAYLFTGPRGTGKTTVARLLAKALNCQQATDDVPICDQCAACTAIREGRSIDVIEIDAASNRGIDDIRALREQVGYPPQELSRKVYIIDEVHMLSKEAFNALLKTLEEPPAHVVFILATTEADKVPVTIQSRCQRLIFRQAGPADLAEQLQRVAEREGISLTPGAVNLLVELAEGGFRDALSLLERAASSGDTIDETAIQQLFSLGDEQRLRQIVSALLADDRQAVFAALIAAEEEGVSASYLVQTIIRQLRRLLYLAAGVALSSADEWETTAAAAASVERLWPWLQAWQEARFETRPSLIPYLPLEIAAARCLSGGGIVEEGLELPDRPDRPNPPAPPAETPLVVRPTAAPATIAAADSKPDSAEPAASSAPTDEQWRQAVAHVTRHNQTIGRLLTEAQTPQLENGRLVVRVAYPFHADQLGQPTNRSLLAEGLRAAGLADVALEFTTAASTATAATPDEAASVHDVIDIL